MLTYKQIAAAVTSTLNTQFPAIPVLEEDVEEGSGGGFERPSFKVLFDAISRDEMLYNSKRSVTIRIYFFPTNLYTYSMEFLDTLDGLEQVFNLTLVCQDRTLTLDNTRNQEIGEATQTKVLEFNFDLRWYDDSLHPQPTVDYKMEDVELNMTED